MYYAVLFEDDEAHAGQRAAHMAEHLNFLKQHADAIHAAGPLTDPHSSSPAGGMWLVEADAADVVRELVKKDPFWPTGLRKSFRILQWRRVNV